MAEINTDDSMTAEAHRRAVREAYGQWVATEQIVIDGALAFNSGDPVPVGHVKQFGLDKSGAVKSTKVAAAKPETSKSS